MQLNGLSLNGWTKDGREARFYLSCTISEAIALDGSALSVTDDDGQLTASLTHQAIASVSTDGEQVTLVTRATVDDETASLIDSLTAQYDSLAAKVDAQGTAQLTTQLDGIASQLTTLTDTLSAVKAVTDALKESKLLGLTIGDTSGDD